MQAGRCCGLREAAVRSRDLHFKPWPFEALPRQSRCPYLPISIRQSDLPEWPSLAATPRLRPSAEQPSCCSRQHRCQRRQPLEGSRSPLPVWGGATDSRRGPARSDGRSAFQAAKDGTPRTPRNASAWTEVRASHPSRC